MKNFKISMIAILAIFAVSCNVDDVEDRPVITAGTAPVLSAPEEGNVYALNSETMDNLAERFVWSAADFGEGIIPGYAVEIDMVGDNFDTPVTIGLTEGATQFAASHAVLNSALTQLGAEPEVVGNFEVRVRAFVGSESMYSNVVEMIITPYQGIVPIKHLYLVGTAMDYGFNNNANNIPMFRDATNQHLFTLTAYFMAGDLKLIENMGSWQPQYGTNNGTTLADSAAGDPGAITVATAGYYTFTVNLEEMTFSLENFDASTATTYASIGITGSATPQGWPDNGVMDSDLTTTATNPHIWRIDNIALSAADAKFRADDAWTVNWGGGSAPAGQASINGSDIPVPEAGTYDIWFNDLDGRYIFIPQQ